MESTRKKLYCIILLILFAFFIIGCKGSNAPKNETQDNRTPVVKTHKITVTTPELPDATMNKPYTFDFADAMDPQGSAPPYIYELGTAKGFPPMGLILSPSGVLRGTPSVKDEVKFDVCATDIGGDYACTTVLLNVKIADEPARDYILYDGNWSGVFSYLYREGHEEENPKKDNQWEMVWTDWKPAEIGVEVTLEPTFPQFSFEENLMTAKMNNYWFMNITKAAVSDPGFGTGPNGAYMGDSKPFPSVANLPYNSTPYSVNPMVAAYLTKEQLSVATMAMKRTLGTGMYFPNGARLQTYPGVLKVSEDGLTLSNSDEPEHANETWMPLNVSSGLLYYYHRWTTPPGEVVNYTAEFRFTGWELNRGKLPKRDISGLYEGNYEFHWEGDNTKDTTSDPGVTRYKCSMDTTASIKICVEQKGTDARGIIGLSDIKDIKSDPSCNPSDHCNKIVDGKPDQCGELVGSVDSFGELTTSLLRIDFEEYKSDRGPGSKMDVSSDIEGDVLDSFFYKSFDADDGSLHMASHGDFVVKKVSDKCPK